MKHRYKVRKVVVMTLTLIFIFGGAGAVAAVADSYYGWSEQWDFGGFCPRCRDE